MGYFSTLGGGIVGSSMTTVELQPEARINIRPTASVGRMLAIKWLRPARIIVADAYIRAILGSRVPEISPDAREDPL